MELLSARGACFHFPPQAPEDFDLRGRPAGEGSQSRRANVIRFRRRKALGPQADRGGGLGRLGEGLQCGVRPPIGFDGILVLVLARNIVVVGAFFSAHSHVLVVVQVPESVVNHPINECPVAQLGTGSRVL